MRYGAFGLVATLGITCCGTPARQPLDAPVIRPNAVSSFGVLYAQNCSGCHGADGQGGLTVGIGRPIYLAVADDATIRRVIQSGRAGTAMPAFAREAGGMLTRAQIDILLRGIRTSWAKPEAFQHVNLPAYAASEPGDPARGKHVFAAFCSSCHGPDGQGSRAIADSSFLALVSDQHLRTVTITGMPTLGMPDWRSHGKPMSDADISDVVAWLAAQRTGLSTNFSSTKLNPPGGVE